MAETNTSTMPSDSPTESNLHSFKVFRPPAADGMAPVPQELPDSYFEPTAADVRAAQTSLSARTQALVNKPLQLRSIRESDEKAKRLERWPNTTIRVRFSDRTQLEKTFGSHEKIRIVYAFVRSSLQEDVKPVKFILYQTPPKRDLKVSDPAVRDQTLSELGLSPSSILQLRFENEHLNRTSVSAPLSSDVLAKAVDLPAPPNYSAEPGPSGSSSDASGSRLLLPGSGEKRIPKWMKAGLRK